MNRPFLAKLLAIASVIGFAVGLLVTVAFGVHGRPDEWLAYASGLCAAVALVLIIP